MLLSIFSELASMVCSHGRSYEYFTESIINAVEKNCSFWAHEWENRTHIEIDKVLPQNCHNKVGSKCIEMGINSDKYKVRGSFIPITDASAPFCSKLPRKEY